MCSTGQRSRMTARWISSTGAPGWTGSFTTAAAPTQTSCTTASRAMWQRRCDQSARHCNHQGGRPGPRAGAAASSCWGGANPGLGRWRQGRARGIIHSPRPRNHRLVATRSREPMPSPFPGMDPYLEDEGLWPIFHHQLVMCLYQILLPGLVDRYRARVSQRHYSTEQALFTSVVREEHHEDYIEVRQRTDGRLITLVDVVSPANKVTAAGRAAYLEKRKEGRSANANLVELDLVLQGQPTLEYSRDGLPDWDYAVTVTRSTQAERYEIYTATLQKRLPRFRLPLAADDRDTV